MQRGKAALIALAVLSAWGCADGAQIKGHVIVAKGYSGQGVFAALWEVPSAPGDPTDPASALVATGGQWNWLGFQAVGIAGDSQQSFTYSFHGLPAGLYAVGAFLWDNQGPGPNLATDVHSLDQSPQDAIPVDPYSKTEQVATKDIYLGLSDPSLGTISGTLHVGASAAMLPVQILVMTGDPWTSQPTLLDQVPVTVSESDVPFQLFNLPAQPAWVIAWADTNQNGLIDFLQDQFGIALENPIAPSAGGQVTGVDLWLGKQGPGLGSLTGNFALSAPLRACEVSLLAFSSDYTTNTDAHVVGVVSVNATNTDTIPFTLPSVPVGKVYLDARTATTGLLGGQVSGLMPYGQTASSSLIPVTVTADTPTSLTYPIGVGRVTGTIQINNAPPTVGLGWVIATELVHGTVIPRQYPSVMFAPGNSTVPYELFGLGDGDFQMTFIPDDMGTGSLDSYSMVAGTPGSPENVTIVGGSPQQSNFTYTFAPDGGTVDSGSP